MIIENKVGKYLKYAIGEIILVVIGILIALQLNDYNDQLKQKRLEQETLHNLKLDFEYNLSAMEKAAQLLTFNRDASLKMINYTGNNYSDHFIVDSLIEVVVHTPQYFPQNGFLLENQIANQTVLLERQERCIKLNKEIV